MRARLRMVRLKCPNCSNVITARAGTAPTCPACGFTGVATPAPAAPAATASPATRPAAVATPFSPVEAPPRGSLPRPGWVTMVAVFQFIGGGFLALGGLLVATVGGSVASLIDHPVADILGSIAAVAGIIMIAIGILEILLGTQVLKGKEWARIVSLVLAFLAAAADAFGLLAGNVFGIFSLAIDVLIIVGLLLPQTVAWFRQEDEARRNPGTYAA